MAPHHKIGIGYLVHYIQVNFSCRHITGFGLTDGEGTERLWSYLRPLATMTKEMTPSHRIDLLNDAVMHYAMRKTAGIGLFPNYFYSACFVHFTAENYI